MDQGGAPAQLPRQDDQQQPQQPVIPPGSPTTCTTSTHGYEVVHILNLNSQVSQGKI